MQESELDVLNILPGIRFFYASVEECRNLFFVHFVFK